MMFGLGLCLSGWNSIVEVCAGERLLMLRCDVVISIWLGFCFVLVKGY